MRTLYNLDNGNLCCHILRKIKCPTLILSKSKDKLIMPDQSFNLHLNIIKARIHIFKKSNAVLQYSMEFNKVITEFLLEK
ncbi:hypothetical protein DMN91_002575 [Ooceraea biroi]|uniref:Uncharacterized protein n=1 Tax=Ooceraea biroi TaxID=2015173 RepID=A0A3L8DVV8_OOCBI|nr:hypothetical protein DMN91_002575 [Ooceraea biroi]